MRSFLTDGISIYPCCYKMTESMADPDIVIRYCCDGKYAVEYFDSGLKIYVNILRGKYCPYCGAKLRPEDELRREVSEFETADRLLEAKSDGLGEVL